MVEHSNKGSDLFDSARRSDLENGIDFLLLRLDSFSSEYETEVFSLKSTKARLFGIDLEIVVTEAIEDDSKLL